MRLFVAVIAMAIAAAAAALVAGASKWNRPTQARVADLNAASSGRDVYREDMIAQLPTPAARYFRRVLRDGQPIVQSAIATQDAHFFLNGAWRPLTATEHFTASPPGFVWDARIAMIPLVAVYVRDSYVNGTAQMTASAMGVYSIVDQKGAPELNAGALQRWLGEAVWFPTALRPSGHVSWSAHDDRSASVTVRDNGIEVSLLFEFDDTGMVTRISGDRYQEDNGAYVMKEWLISCDEAREFSGMTIPARCEVAWLNNGTPEPYWKGRISTMTYTFE
jgi:hypothetical protein